jgi:hypothetical protein
MNTALHPPPRTALPPATTPSVPAAGRLWALSTLLLPLTARVQYHRPQQVTALPFPSPDAVSSSRATMAVIPSSRSSGGTSPGTCTANHGRRFGFQATFFRRSRPPHHERHRPTGTPTHFGHHELHLAHMALLDVQGKRFIHEERLNRAGGMPQPARHPGRAQRQLVPAPGTNSNDRSPCREPSAPRPLSRSN